MTESRLKENATAVKKLFGTAAKLAQKQAALATLSNVTLPKIYHAIGKKIVGLDNLPPDLAPHREKIRALEARIAERPDQPTTTPAEGFAAKAKQLAKQAAQKASKASADAAATMQIQAAYVALGKDAVEKYGEKAIPKECASSLAEALETRESLSKQVMALRNSSRLGIFTPSRTIVGVLAAGCIGVAIFLRPSGEAPTSGSRPIEVTPLDNEEELKKLQDLARGATATGADDFERDFQRGRAQAKLRAIEQSDASAVSDVSLGELPEHLEIHRKAVLILKSMYADSGQASVDAQELSRAMNILANGHMLNARKAEVEKLLMNLRQVAKDTGKGIEQILEEMGEYKLVCMSDGLVESYAERTYPKAYKNKPARDPRSEVQPMMICPSCKGTGSTNPDNPRGGSICLVCGGKGQRRVGR